MKIRVHLKSSSDNQAKVFILLEAAISKNFIFENPAMDKVADKEQPVKQSIPNLTYNGIEAAFRSGVFYARHRIKTDAIFAKLLSFGWEGNVENSIPFAVATTVAIYDAIAGIRSYTVNDLSGWEVVSVERE